MVVLDGHKQRLFTMAAPLIVGDSCLGALVVQTHTPKGVYDEEDLKLLVLLAGSAAPILYIFEDKDELESDNMRLRALAGEGDTLVGSSRTMGALRKQLRYAAKTLLNVLLTGETGTGKEVAARMVHALSLRHDRSFVVVNCAAIPRDLFESEFFGYRKGAFTGALQDKPGLLAGAHGGTLFLDEVGDLSLENQARILRVVEQGTFRPIGGEEEICLSLRIVAATNKNLKAGVDAGIFRADLYHRLAAYQMEMPPLRDHREDIPTLVLHFIEQLQCQGKAPINGVAPEALENLRRRAWPGNVRELRNAVQRAMALSRGPILQSRDFPLQSLTVAGTGGPPVILSLAEVEKYHIKTVIDACGGNLKAAAESLGIARSTLYKKISEYDIE
ncbi:MAG: Transcriptional regulatory protein ZraR [Candidatus Hydrogenedentes bacterium ADurb.Bin179]|nr:MAG: Transcriptional regulatory protein ZraR [Candidatus Hydrogenedentes bacterium ADurb.Bin179]